MTRRPLVQDAGWHDDRTVVDPSPPIRTWEAQASPSIEDAAATVIVERRATELGSRFELPGERGACSRRAPIPYTWFRRRPTAAIAITVFLLTMAVIMASWLRTGQRTRAQEVQRRAVAIREEQEGRQREIAERARERTLVREREAARVQAQLDAFLRERGERQAAIRMREAILSEIRRRPPRTNAVSDAIAKERSELEKAGADLLAANNHPEALAFYRKLAAIFPEEPPFVDLVAILEDSGRCKGGEKCR